MKKQLLNFSETEPRSKTDEDWGRGKERVTELTAWLYLHTRTTQGARASSYNL